MPARSARPTPRIWIARFAVIASPVVVFLIEAAPRISNG